MSTFLLSLPPWLAWLAATCLPLGALWLLFQVAFRAERCFGYNRGLLLLAPLVAALLPLLPRPELPAWSWPGAAGETTGAVSATVLLPALRAGRGVETTAWAGWPWLLALYGVGVGLGLGRLAWQLWRLRRATRALPREQRAGYALARTGGQLPTSSFGRTIFWDETAGLSAAEADSVLAHELAHVRQGHSYDVLWLEVWRAVLWPNPFAHLLLPALRLTHELLADRAASTIPTPLEAANAAAPAPYAALLARLTARRLAGPAYSTLLQPFTFSFTLTRLAMLQNQTPVRRWKQWLTLPVLAGLVACQPESAQIAPLNAQSALSKNSSPAERQAWKEQVMKNVKKAFREDSLATGGKRIPGQTLHLAIKRDASVELELIRKTGPPPPPKLLNISLKIDYDYPGVSGSFMGKGNPSNAVIMRGISEFVEGLAQKDSEPEKPDNPNEPKVYTYVEQMPELPGGGGNAAIVQAIQKNLVYPAGSRGAEGRVFVQFTVGADGAVRDATVIKPKGSIPTTPQYLSPGPAYDAAVIAAVQQLPRFTPGRQSGKPVAVSFTVPVQFELAK